MRGEIAAKMFGDVRERQRIPDDLTNDTLIALLARLWRIAKHRQSCEAGFTVAVSELQSWS